MLESMESEDQKETILFVNSLIAIAMVGGVLIWSFHILFPKPAD